MNGVGTGLKGAKQWAVSVYGPYSHTPVSVWGEPKAPNGLS